MNKKIIFLSIAAVAAIGFASCSNEDAPDSGVTPEPEVKSARTAYILSQGNYYSFIEGSLDVINLTEGTISTDVFLKANGRNIGATPQWGLAYGSKLYVAMPQSNTIEIVDPSTYKSVKQIKLSESGFDGTGPRSMATKDGKVYISMLDGYVCRLDTVSMEIDASVKVGANPEIIAIHGDKIYVPNSDGMNNPDYGTTASVISIDDFKVESTITVPMNPKQFISANGNLYLICMGNYGDVAAALYKIGTDNTYTEVTTATIADPYEDKLYIVDNPYGGTPSYKIYDMSSGTLETTDFSEVVNPSKIAVDPSTGEILISSYKDKFDAYNLPEILYQYDKERKLIKKYDIGIGEPCIFFNSKP